MDNTLNCVLPTFNKSMPYRLGNCEVCDMVEARYTCPKCEVKTCCLNCLNIHKKELDCNGIRDRINYIPLTKMTDANLYNDYNFVEECSRYVEKFKGDNGKLPLWSGKRLPIQLFNLKTEANSRKITLKFLTQKFSKTTSNTTIYNWKTKTIYWHIDWVFVNADFLKFVDNNCSEHLLLSELLAKYFDVGNSENYCVNDPLKYYKSKGLQNVKLLLKSEGIPNCKSRFYKMDANKTLNDNLAGKIIIEYPVVYLTYNSDEFDIIGSDDDIDAEKPLPGTYLNNTHTGKQSIIRHCTEELRMHQPKKKKLKTSIKKRSTSASAYPHNYLFSNDCSSSTSNSTDDEI